jgi:NAD(P)-dependent dehydrogenase (short-subunit alcohol dehydrogenase family)
LTTLAHLADAAMDRTVVPGYTRWGLHARRAMPGWPADAGPVALHGRAAVVTGASSGLGIATVEGLARLGAQVHLVVRNTDKGQRVLAALRRRSPDASLRLWRCDVADLDDVRRFTAELAAEVTDLHVLVHNAGVMPPRRTETAQGHEVAAATHVLGPLLMTEGLRGSLEAGGRVVLVSSGGMYAQRVPDADPEYRLGRYRPAAAYARTKRMQVAVLSRLVERWGPDGIDVAAMHPGWADTPGIRTSLPRFRRITAPALRTAAEGADTTVWLAATEPAPPSGWLWQDRRRRPPDLVPWTRATVEQRERLWGWCTDALGWTSR